MTIIDQRCHWKDLTLGGEANKLTLHQSSYDPMTVMGAILKNAIFKFIVIAVYFLCVDSVIVSKIVQP